LVLSPTTEVTNCQHSNLHAIHLHSFLLSNILLRYIESIWIGAQRCFLGCSCECTWVFLFHYFCRWSATQQRRSGIGNIFSDIPTTGKLSIITVAKKIIGSVTRRHRTGVLRLTEELGNEDVCWINKRNPLLWLALRPLVGDTTTACRDSVHF